MKVTLGSSFDNNVHKTKSNDLHNSNIDITGTGKINLHPNTPNTNNTPNTQILLSKYFKQNIISSSKPSPKYPLPSFITTDEIVIQDTSNKIDCIKDTQNIQLNDLKENNVQQHQQKTHENNNVSLNDFTQLLVESLKNTLNTNQFDIHVDKKQRIQYEEKKIPISHKIKKLSQLSSQPSVSRPNIKKTYQFDKKLNKPFHPKISVINYQKNYKKPIALKEKSDENNIDSEWNIDESVFDQPKDLSNFTHDFKNGKNYIDINASDFIKVLKIDNDKTENIIKQKEIVNLHVSDFLTENFPTKQDAFQNEKIIQYTLPNTQNTQNTQNTASNTQIKKINEAAKKKYNDAELASKNRRDVLTQRSRIM